MEKCYLNTWTGELYTYDEVCNYLLEHCLDDTDRKEFSCIDENTLDDILYYINYSLSELDFVCLSPEAVEKINSSAANDCYCENSSISNRDCKNSCSCGNVSLYNSNSKGTDVLTGKDVLELIEKAQFEDFKNSIGAKLTDKEKANAKNKVPNFYCGFIDDKEMEKSIKQLLNKMAQK